MIDAQLPRLLNELRALTSENEWVKFKKAERNFDFDDLGRYFSALSNEVQQKTAELIIANKELVFQNEERDHQGLDEVTPSSIYFQSNRAAA